MVISWYQLLGVLRNVREERRIWESRPRVACPNDGEPLRAGPGGQVYCPFDGWRPGDDGWPDR